MHFFLNKCFYVFLNKNSYPVTCLFRIPYNWRDIDVSLFSMCFQMIQMIISIALTLLFQCSFVGCCQFLVIFVDDIKQQLHDLNDDVRNQSKIFTVQKNIEVKRKLCRIIELHGDTIQLSLWIKLRVNCYKLNFCLLLPIFRLAGNISNFFCLKIVTFSLIAGACATLLLLQTTIVSCNWL